MTSVFAPAAHRKLVLVRHGEAAGADDADPGLSRLGQWQAEQLGTRLHGRRFSRLLHSPLRRAADTAAVLSSATELRPEPSSLLSDLTPVPSSGNRELYPTELLPWLEDTAPAERDVDGVRLTANLAELVALARAADDPLVLVTHAFVIAWFVRVVRDAPVRDWLNLHPSNCGLTVVDCGAAMCVDRFDDVAHLTGPAGSPIP